MTAEIFWKFRVSWCTTYKCSKSFIDLGVETYTTLHPRNTLWGKNLRVRPIDHFARRAHPRHLHESWLEWKIREILFDRTSFNTLGASQVCFQVSYQVYSLFAWHFSPEVVRFNIVTFLTFMATTNLHSGDEIIISWKSSLGYLVMPWINGSNVPNKKININWMKISAQNIVTIKDRIKNFSSEFSKIVILYFWHLKNEQ